MNILVLNGPNLNRLGHREAAHYGALTYDALVALLIEEGRALGLSVDVRQSNHEGDLIDWLHASEGHYDGIVINPGAFTHYAYAVRDAIEAIDVPCVEVHLSDIYSREPFRSVSVTKSVCKAQFYGKKEKSYLEALAFLKALPEFKFSDKIR